MFIEVESTHEFNGHSLEWQHFQPFSESRLEATSRALPALNMTTWLFRKDIECNKHHTSREMVHARRGRATLPTLLVPVHSNLCYPAQRAVSPRISSQKLFSFIYIIL